MKRFAGLLLLLFPLFISAQESFTVFFESNKHELNKKQTELLQNWITGNKDSKIVAINGFADEVGTNVYNDSLSRRRVNSIHGIILKNNMKIRDDFKTRSFGEGFQQSKIKAENRKVIIYYILPKDLHRENEILGIKPAELTEEGIVPIEEEDMHFPENATLEDKVKLARVGTRIVMKDILFYQNTFAVVPSSKRAIDELLMVLDRNPNMRIEIQGHICCVKEDKRNLSLERAKQIRRILEGNMIPGKRIKVKGFGVSHPKFPIPEANDAQAAANRRVEIMILSK
ncbi:OmpA family protein [Flavobacterium sp. SM15]|uniref:OmpA family protein n=1 Tax=Flavobacterium sp. SM15 TaxID=2908005 RepID=UPI001EDC8D57|nr:OmpA family protein [Flavobacterium sp. SM15]MCG2612522.1 OmpA family protein [Flavobacterium sp. SM15]